MLQLTLLVLACTMLTGPVLAFDFTSMRIQALGGSLSGIVEDAQTDAAANPVLVGRASRMIAGSYGFYETVPGAQSRFSNSIRPLTLLLLSPGWGAYLKGGYWDSGGTSVESGIRGKLGSWRESTSESSYPSWTTGGALVLSSPHKRWGVEVSAGRPGARQHSTYTSAYFSRNTTVSEDVARDIYTSTSTRDAVEMPLVVRWGWAGYGRRQIILHVRAVPSWSNSEDASGSESNYDYDGNGRDRYGYDITVTGTRLSASSRRTADEIRVNYIPGGGAEFRSRWDMGDGVSAATILGGGYRWAGVGAWSESRTSDTTITGSTTTTTVESSGSGNRDGGQAKADAGVAGGLEMRRGRWVLGAAVRLNGSSLSTNFTEIKSYRFEAASVSTASALSTWSTTTVRTDEATSRNTQYSGGVTGAVGVEYDLERVAFRLGSAYNQSFSRTEIFLEERRGEGAQTAVSSGSTVVAKTAPSRYESSSVSRNSTSALSFTGGMAWRVSDRLSAETAFNLDSFRDWRFQMTYQF